MSDSVQFSLAPADNARLANLCGEMDGNIHCIARALSVKIKRRGERFQLNGAAASAAAETLKTLYRRADRPFDQNAVRLHLARQLTAAAGDDDAPPPAFAPPADMPSLRNPAQAAFWQKIRAHAVTLCAGPAGSGKTYVALAAALALLREGAVRRLVLTRPAVEAGGERLGFLPGDMEQKVNPYLRPMHDTLYQLLGRQESERRMNRGDIEMIPLAFMRGLTLNDAAVILDEAQNTTPAQIKMLLTRLGESAKIIIVGDTTQSDLPPATVCGLSDAAARLRGVRDIACHTFGEADIVRHPLVRRILRAYENGKNE